MPPSPNSVANLALWDRVFCRVRFTPNGLQLDCKRYTAPEFTTLVTKAQKSVAAAKLSANMSLSKAASAKHESSVSKREAMVRTDLAKGLPFFDEHITEVSHQRITHFYFYSEDVKWKFYDPGFEPKEAVHENQFQATQIVEDGYAVQTWFIPKGLAGQWIPYNLWMRTEVSNYGVGNGHAIIIIDPILETREVPKKP